MDFVYDGIMSFLHENGFQHRENKTVFADLFAGTGAVGKRFKQSGFNVVANDIQHYSFVTNRHYIGNTSKSLPREKSKEIFGHLNDIDGQEGYIFRNYSPGGTRGKEDVRMYFSDGNALKCDGIRIELERLLQGNEISEELYYYALASLLECIDKVANTASVYGAFLKAFKSSARKTLELKPLEIIDGSGEYQTFNDDIMSVLDKTRGHVLYLDPPYNERQYCANYHMLETISKYDNPVIAGKTGLRDYSAQKSAFCSQKTVKEAFTALLEKADFQYVFLSYNNEGLMSHETIRGIMSRFGDYKILARDYRRFKADKDGNRTHSADKTTEYLHCLVKC
jgi:adenine-specific DNA-methyltransferase